jgi:hypothetical protein
MHQTSLSWRRPSPTLHDSVVNKPVLTRNLKEELPDLDVQIPWSRNEVFELAALYQSAIGSAFDIDEFLGDDFYALQVLDRAIGTAGHGDLVALSSRMRAARLEQRSSIDASAVPQVIANSNLAMTGAQATLTYTGPERRQSRRSYSQAEMVLVSSLARLTKKHLGVTLDVTRFDADDAYAAEMLNAANASGKLELTTIALYFMDESGRPRMHRRSSR